MDAGPFTDLRRFIGLPDAQRSLLLKVIPIVALVRLALWTMSFATARQFLQCRAITGLVSRRLVATQAAELAWAVHAASRGIPAATCLTQSLALQFLLTQTGRPAALCIGVAKLSTSPLTAHAWVECAGEVLLDQPADVRAYALLASLEMS
jgi:hypothetical protein